MRAYNGNSRAEEYLQERKFRKRWKKITWLLAAVVAIAVTGAMVLPGLTMEKEPGTLCCALNLHTHVDSCYDADGNLICGYADFVVHTHNAFCYDDNGELICPLEEIQAHTHDASCYQTNLVQICDLEETEGHVHTDQCYAWSSTLACTQQEGSAHTHDASCYDVDGTLICEESTEGHIHTEECYVPQRELICGQLEAEPHTHTSTCFEAQEILVCGKEEVVLHPHTADCYDANGQLICGQLEVREHVHDEACLPAQENQENTDGISLDETSRATVYKPGFSAMRTRLAAANGLRATSIDFAPYVTSISLERNINNQWVPVTTEVTSGDSIRVYMTYSIPDGIVGPGSNVIHYQFPTGIGLREQASGPVTIGGEVVGTYTISTNGLIQLTFTSEFADGTAFTGDLEFLGMVTATGETGQDEIDLGFDGGTILVKPGQVASDLTIAKIGTYDETQNLITYRITVSTDIGTDGNITIEDAFTHAPAYGSVRYQDILSFQKKDAQGSLHNVEIGQDDLIVTSQTQDEAASFRLNNLPALQAGESYILTYTAVPDLTSPGTGNGYLQFTNRATAVDQTNTAEASANIQVSKAMIAKEYTYDVLTRKIQWKIYINEGQRDISGWTLSDTLTYTVDGRTYTMDLPETVTITALWNYAPTGASYDIPLPFTFPENSNAQYVITYETEIPTDVSSESGIVFHNTAAIDDYWVKIDVEGPTIGEYGVIKGSLSQDAESGIVQWAASIAHPVSPALDQLSYVDLLSGVVLEDGTQLLESHYTTKALLTSSLTVQTVDGQTQLTYGPDYTVMAVSKADIMTIMEQYNVSVENLSWLVAEYAFTDMVGVFPWADVNAFASDEPLGMFAIVFTDNALQKISDINLLVTYNTQIDKGSLPESSRKVTVYNLGRIPDDYSLAQIEMAFYKKIDKQASLTGVAEGSQNTSSFTDDPLIVHSGDDGTLLHYRIMISDYGDKTEVTVTDILPEGATFMADSVVLRLHPNNWNAFTAETDNPYYIQNVTVTPNLDGTTTVTFLIGHLNDLENHTFGIYYDVSVASDAQLIEAGEKTYLNVASWDGNTDSTLTTVEYHLPHLEKMGEQLPDMDVLRYYVIINPEGDRLNPYNENLTLEDSLTIPTGCEAYFEPNTVKLYHYDETAEENHFCGTPIDTSQYSAEYNSETRTITFTLPDQTASVLIYDYSIERGSAAGDLSISNVAKLSGSADYSSESNLVVEEQQSSATVNKATMTIYKYKSGNLLHLLPGARFKLERYEFDSTGYTWKQTSLTATGDDGDFVVGEDGMLILNFVTEEQSGGSMYNTLYRLQETVAPEGYMKTDDFYYFVWMEKDATEASTIAQMTESGALGNLSAAQVEFIPYSTAKSLYVPNAEDHLTVTKKWRSENGEVLTEIPVDSVTVTLYQWTQDGQKTPYGEKIELTTANDWSYTWKSLPKIDSHGDPYLYTVEETPVSGFEVAYSQNNEQGIQIGDIEITNTRNGYVLPETGGMGNLFLIATGVLLIGACGIGYGLLQHRRRKRNQPAL